MILLIIRKKNIIINRKISRIYRGYNPLVVGEFVNEFFYLFEGLEDGFEFLFSTIGDDLWRGVNCVFEVGWC